jgi:hypothetical protein
MRDQLPEKRWDRWEAALSPEAQGIRPLTRRGATESTELFGYVVFYRLSETGRCLWRQDRYLDGMRVVPRDGIIAVLDFLYRVTVTCRDIGPIDGSGNCI